MNNWHVMEYTSEGVFVGVCSGLGEHKGTLDSNHSERTAKRLAAEWNTKCPEGHKYVAEEWV